MHLIQLFLPVYDNNGKSFPNDFYIRIRKELVQKFGGLTAFTRSPADGLWKDEDDKITKDKIVIFEVMLKSFDESWWINYKASLEKMFIQEEIIIRIQDIRLL